LISLFWTSQELYLVKFFSDPITFSPPQSRGQLDGKFFFRRRTVMMPLTSALYPLPPHQTLSMLRHGPLGSQQRARPSACDKRRSFREPFSYLLLPSLGGQPHPFLTQRREVNSSACSSTSMVLSSQPDSGYLGRSKSCSTGCRRQRVLLSLARSFFFHHSLRTLTPVSPHFSSPLTAFTVLANTRRSSTHAHTSRPPPPPPHQSAFFFSTDL